MNPDANEQTLFQIYQSPGHFGGIYEKRNECNDEAITNVPSLVAATALRLLRNFFT
jgi:hypothetical protein